MSLTKSERAILFQMFGGMCAYCGKPLPDKGWHADHINAVIRETKWRQNPKTGLGEFIATGKLYRPHNDVKDGFYPSCAPCNIDKGCGSIEDFRRGIAYKITALRNNHAGFRHLERFNMLSIVDSPVVFYFEKFAVENGDPK